MGKLRRKKEENMANLIAKENDHFPDVGKMVKIGSGMLKPALDYNQIANLFRISQTKAMIDMETTLPENLPTPEKSIQIIEREEIKKLRNSKTKLMLDE